MGHRICERTVFVCDCGSIEHQFAVLIDEEEEEVIIEIRLNSYGNIFERIWRAIKYVLKIGNGEYDCVILNKDNTDKLVKLLLGIKE